MKQPPSESCRCLIPQTPVSSPALVCILLALISPVRGDTLITPANVASQFGNTFTDPLFLTNPNLVQVYGSQEFASAGAGPLLISAIAFRLDPADATSLNVTLPELFIWATTYPGSLSAANLHDLHQLPHTLVLNTANLHLQAKPTTPGNFAVQIPFQTPFLYDPAKGALALDFHGGLGGGFIQAMDAQRSADGVTLGYDAGGREVLDSVMTVTKFTYTTVAEPSSLSLTALAFGIALLCPRKAQRITRRPLPNATNGLPASRSITSNGSCGFLGRNGAI